MKILFLSDNFPPETNAPASRLHEHALRWVRAGHDVTVITCVPNFPDGVVFPGYVNRWRQVEVIDGIRVVRVKTYISANSGVIRRTLDYMSFMVMSFLAGLFERRPDVVVATSPQFFCAVGGWMLSALRFLPFVFELRDLWPASIAAVGAMRQSRALRMMESLELFLYRRASRVVAVTNSFRENLIARGIPGNKVAVVINGVDLGRFQPKPPDVALAEELGLTGKFVVGYIGTLGMAHALNSALKAAELLLAHPEIQFVFVGAGAERANLMKSAVESGLGNVKFVERQGKSAMPRYWSLCSVCLIPLRDTDVFRSVIPSKIFESMGMGIPILMSLPEGEATALVRESGAGACVAPESPETLASEILRLSKAPEQLNAMRESGLKAAQTYSRDYLAESMLGHLQDAASARD